jgi:hypothetical protein
MRFGFGIKWLPTWFTPGMGEMFAQGSGLVLACLRNLRIGTATIAMIATIPDYIIRRLGVSYEV